MQVTEKRKNMPGKGKKGKGKKGKGKKGKGKGRWGSYAQRYHPYY
eukprot:SAG11_NODE_11401_length_763_cov_0.914157_1_plen_45_part_00